MTVSEAATRQGKFRVPAGIQSTLLSLAGIGSVIVLWAYAGSSTRFVASVPEVVGGMPAFLSDGDVWSAIGQTWIRVLTSLAIGLVLGSAVAVLMWKSEFFGRVASTYVALFLAVPSTISALLAVFLFKNVQFGAVMVLVATVFPFVTLMVYGALQRIDPGLDEMASTYRFSRWQRSRSVVLPQVFAAVMTSVRNEHAHAWKVVVVVELFLVSSGMGFEFDKSFSRFDLVEVMQWLIVFATILLASEYLVIRPLEKRSQKWKETA